MAYSTFVPSMIWKHLKDNVCKVFQNFKWRFVYIMLGLSWFWLFIDIIFVLELLAINVVCMQNSYNALKSFCTSPKVPQKHDNYNTNKNLFNTFFLYKLGNEGGIVFKTTIKIEFLFIISFFCSLPCACVWFVGYMWL